MSKVLEAIKKIDGLLSESKEKRKRVLSEAVSGEGVNRIYDMVGQGLEPEEVVKFLNSWSDTDSLVGFIENLNRALRSDEDEEYEVTLNNVREVVIDASEDLGWDFMLDNLIRWFSADELLEIAESLEDEFGLMTESERTSTKDVKTIEAFIQKDAFEGKTLNSTGSELEYTPMGRVVIAKWNGEVIDVLEEFASRTHQRLARKVKKMIPSKLLGGGLNQQGELIVESKEASAVEKLMEHFQEGVKSLYESCASMMPESLTESEQAQVQKIAEGLQSLMEGGLVESKSYGSFDSKEEAIKNAKEELAPEGSDVKEGVNFEVIEKDGKFFWKESKTLKEDLASVGILEELFNLDLVFKNINEDYTITLKDVDLDATDQIFDIKIDPEEQDPDSIADAFKKLGFDVKI